MKAVIPAAGLGTRFLPYTKSQPKEMLPVVDKPAIQYVVEEALESGITDVIIVTGRGKRAIEDHFDRAIEHEEFLRSRGDTSRLDELEKLWKRVNILYVRQKEPRGLGHAILTAESHLRDGPFAVLLGDDITVDHEPCTAQLERAFKQTGTAIVGAQHIERSRIPNYGMIVGSGQEPNLVRVEEIIEKPLPSEVRSNLAVMGRYILPPQIFDHLQRAQEVGSGEIQLTDAIRELARQMDVYALVFAGRRYDVGDKIEWMRANLELGMERADLAIAVRALVEELSHSRAR